MLAGSPAKLIMEGVQRVENVRTENMLKVFFKTHDESFIVSDKMNIDNFCMA